MESAALRQVANLRSAILANGFRPIRVRTARKEPAAPSWQNGEDAAVLALVTPTAANTGILCGEARAVDVDCDDEAVASAILDATRHYLPAAPLIRRRTGSCRLALIYRAAEGQPVKLVASGTKGKVEILGKGQQLLSFGTHPSGGELIWHQDRSPASVPFDQLPAVTEEQIGAFLAACRPILGAAPTSEGHLPQRPKVRVRVETGTLGSSVTSVGNLPFHPEGIAEAKVANDELGAGIDSGHWFDLVSPSQMERLVKTCLDAIDNRKSDPRDRWLSIVFAVADAGRRGCTNARQLALEWSRRGAGWTSEQDFDSLWDSARASGGITVATLIFLARHAGENLDSWLPAAKPDLNYRSPLALPASAGQFSILSVSQIPLIPSKRQWLHGTDVIRGAVTLLTAPGGRGKSSWLLALALACASGKQILGSTVFGAPLKVIYINAEDSTKEISLRLRTAMRHHGFTDAELTGLGIAGADLVDLSLLHQDKTSARLNQDCFDKLGLLIDQYRPDIMIIDPLVAVMGGVSVNDNAAAALMMKALVRLASQHNIGIVLAHHNSKNRDASSAESAMGAASYVNLSRIVLSVETLTAEEAEKVGVASWNRHSIFRVSGSKQNLSAHGVLDRLFQLASVEIPNAEPPIYLNGDSVGVVECFIPNSTGPVYSQPVIDAALGAIATANPPLSPHGRKSSHSAASVIATAIAPFRAGVSTIDALAVIDHLRRTGKIVVRPVMVPRIGRGAYRRDGLVVV